MAGSIGVPANSLDLKLGQGPNLQDSQLNAELQGIYNALHTLNSYTEALRQELEGTDSQVPSDSLRFRRRFEAVALQPVVAGNIVCPVPGGVIKGVQTRAPTVTTRWGTGSGAIPRRGFNQINYLPFVALGDAAAGEVVKVGVPVGVLELPGVKCGQILWAADTHTTWTFHGATNGTRFNNGVWSRQTYGDGGLYTGVPATGSLWLGYNRVGDYHYVLTLTFWPVAVAIADNFVLLRDKVTDNIT